MIEFGADLEKLVVGREGIFIMSDMDIQTKAYALVEYLSTLEDFEIVDDVGGKYNHMGATISATILQAGINYDNVVRPRIQRLLKNYPEVVTTSDFKHLIENQDINAILDWKDDEKPRRVRALTEFLIEHGIETEKQLVRWLEDDTSTGKLRSVRGVGPKSVDYLKILVGFQTAAADRHIKGILSDAGIHVDDYSGARDIVNIAADSMCVQRADLDHSIWRYMIRRTNNSN